MPTTDDQIHRELASLSPQILRMLQDIDRTHHPKRSGGPSPN